MAQDHVRGINEHDLIQQAARGNHEAFCHLVTIYEQALLRYLTALLGSRENALDMAQETFLAAFYALPRWTPLRESREKEMSLSKLPLSILSLPGSIASQPIRLLIFSINKRSISL